ncbi:ectonucleotide pyrophosphatase/phosphodiesterase family member 6-like isoform X4, partial [Leptotrombidium deliense]
WDGCQVAISNTTPTYCAEYQSYWTWPKVKEDTIDALHEILDNFESDEWQLALVYYEAIDATGHAWGPETEERVHAVRDLDDILFNLTTEIYARKMDKEVNVVLVSDHGMTTVDTEGNFTVLIDLENIINEDDVEMMLDRGSTSFLYPKRGKEEKIYNTLKKAKVKGMHYYRKSDLPEHYHIKHHRRVSPIVLVADKGYFVRGFSSGGKTKPVWDVLYTGHHGYDPYEVDQMRTIMYAVGPGLKKNYVNEPLMMTDHYNLICHLLGIEAQPNNGSWLRVQNMLAKSSRTIKRSPIVQKSQANLINNNNNADKICKANQVMQNNVLNLLKLFDY